MLSAAHVMEDLNGLRVCRTVQLPQIAKCALPRTVGRTYGLHQRPIAVLYSVSNAPMLAKEHLAPIMAAENFAAQEGRSALKPIFEGFGFACQ